MGQRNGIDLKAKPLDELKEADHHEKVQAFPAIQLLPKDDENRKQG